MNRGRKGIVLLGAAGIGSVSIAIAIVVAAPVWHATAARTETASVQSIPAEIAKATRQDVPIYTTGVGAVQAYQSVLVRSRVDGTLLRVPVREGQAVKQGDLIAVIDPRPYEAVLDQANARKTQDEAQLANARLDLERFRSLATQSFASRQQVDTQQALVNQYAATVTGDNAAIEAAQLNLTYCVITSPVDGRVGLRQVDPGNLIHATDATGIVTIAQVNPISATFTLPQDELPRIQLDTSNNPLQVLAYDTGDRTQLDAGSLLTPDNTIDSTTGTIRLKATFANARNTLWPGQFINAHLRTGIERDAVTIPPAAIQHGPDGLYVYVVRQDGTVASQPVATGYQNATLAIVTHGLSGGEEVVVDGQSRLQAGTKVTAAHALNAS